MAYPFLDNLCHIRFYIIVVTMEQKLQEDV